MPDLLPSLAPCLAEDANVSDELRGAGIAFGTLVERTGAAVAATQLQLDTSSAATASALASTLVNVIAVRERVFRDDGTLDHVTNHVRPLPLISFIDPVFYQWTSVRLQGEFSRASSRPRRRLDHDLVRSDSGLFGSGLSMVLGPRMLPAAAPPARAPPRRRCPPMSRSVASAPAPCSSRATTSAFRSPTR